MKQCGASIPFAIAGLVEVTLCRSAFCICSGKTGKYPGWGTRIRT